MLYPISLAFIFTLGIYVAGCSSAPLRIEPMPAQNQSVSYERGQAQLTSETDHLLGLTIVDYSNATMIIGVSVSNTGEEPFNFSGSNVAGELVFDDGTRPVTVYPYEAIAEQLDITNYDAMKQVGLASVSVGSGFVPFGGIAVSVANLLLSVGQMGIDSDEDPVDALTASQLKKVYLRRHTLMPGADYRGLLKISFPDELEDGNYLVFTLTADQETKKFSFLCKRNTE